MAHEPREGAFELAHAFADPLFCCVQVCRPIWDRTIAPDIIMVDAVSVLFKLRIEREILLHELVLKEEASITKLARGHI